MHVYLPYYKLKGPKIVSLDLILYPVLGSSLPAYPTYTYPKETQGKQSVLVLDNYVLGRSTKVRLTFTAAC